MLIIGALPYGLDIYPLRTVESLALSVAMENTIKHHGNKSSFNEYTFHLQNDPPTINLNKYP